jgi:hypothetical protein
MKTLVATAALAAFIASPALAQSAGSRSQVRQPPAPVEFSVDGITMGHERTCGHPVYQYDSDGIPTGPYCH